MQEENAITAGQAIGRVLKEEGVEYIFGVGGGSIFPVLVGACEQGIKIVHTRHEQAAAFAADGYARAARSPGVCFLFGGPGYANACNGIAMAYAAKSPMIALVGQTTMAVDYRGNASMFQAAEAALRMTKNSMRLLDDRLAAVYTKKAFIQARSYPPGPVVLELPENLLATKRPAAQQRWYLPGFLPQMPTLGGANASDVERAVRLLLSANRPVVAAGESVYWEDASDELRELVELLRCPVITRRIARGAVPEDHPLAFGGRVRGAVLRQADVALLVGLNLGYLEGHGRWGRRTRFIQLQHSESEVETHVETELAILGNSKAILQQMIDCATSLIKDSPATEGWLETINNLKSAEDARLASEAEKSQAAKPINPSYLAKEILDFLDDSATVIFDAYTGSAYLTERLKAKLAGHVIDTGEWITVGHGIGMGIGAQVARPGKQVFVMMGDGGLGMGGFDVETAVRCKLPVVYLINNNSSWLGHVVDLFFGDQLLLSDGRPGNPFSLTPNVHYDQLFATFGCHVERVEDPREIKPALYRSFNSGNTSIIDVVVDPKVYHPMVAGSGREYRYLDPRKMPEMGRRLAFPETSTE